MNLPKPAPTTPLGKRFAKRLSEHQFERLPAPADENNLDKLFNQQANKLLELQFDQHAPVKEDIFWERIWRLKKLVKNIKPRKKCIPFLIIIPQTVINLQAQAALLNIDCQEGSKFFAKNGLPIMPGVEPPRLPYLAANVNIGADLVEVSPNKAQKKFNRWWRWNKLLPLTVDEGFALVMYCQKILKIHTIDLIATQFGANGVPGLLSRGDGAWIVRRPADRGALNRLPAFCHQRLTP